MATPVPSENDLNKRKYMYTTTDGAPTQFSTGQVTEKDPNRVFFLCILMEK